MSSSDFLVLAVLADEDRLGYGIVKDTEARTGGKMRRRPGDLYRVVDRLIDRGLVKEGRRKSVEGSSEEHRH